MVGVKILQSQGKPRRNFSISDLFIYSVYLFGQESLIFIREKSGKKVRPVTTMSCLVMYIVILIIWGEKTILRTK